jgi:hypothetical protein
MDLNHRSSGESAKTTRLAHEFPAMYVRNSTIGPRKMHLVMLAVRQLDINQKFVSS